MKDDFGPVKLFESDNSDLIAHSNCSTFGFLLSGTVLYRSVWEKTLTCKEEVIRIIRKK